MHINTIGIEDFFFHYKYHREFAVHMRIHYKSALKPRGSFWVKPTFKECAVNRFQMTIWYGGESVKKSRSAYFVVIAGQQKCFWILSVLETFMCCQISFPSVKTSVPTDITKAGHAYKGNRKYITHIFIYIYFPVCMSFISKSYWQVLFVALTFTFDAISTIQEALDWWR